MDATTNSSIALSLKMTRAMTLARQGKMRDAQALVAGDQAIPDHPVALHALAALVTSEGDYLRALRLWEALLQHDPNHAEAKYMIDAIELWLARPSWFRYLPMVGMIVGALALVGIFFWLTAEPPALPAKTPIVERSNVTTAPSNYSQPAPSAPVKFNTQPKRQR